MKKKEITRADIEAKVLEVVRKISEDKNVTIESEFERDVPLDSLDQLEVAMEMEREFDIDFGFKTPHWSTVVEIVNDVEKQIIQHSWL